MNSWDKIINREINRFQRKLLAAGDSFAVHDDEKIRAAECDAAAATLRACFEALQLELHEFVGIEAPNQLGAYEYDTATFGMEDAIRSFRLTVGTAWTVRRLHDGVTRADRELLFDAMCGARRALCKAAILTGFTFFESEKAPDRFPQIHHQSEAHR